MEPFAIRFAELANRELSDLDTDERESLDFYYASVNLTEGLPADSAPRRWCTMATTVARLSHMLGGLPRSGDPGVTPQITQWIEQQRSAHLNSFQRARLRSFPGGVELV
ncbi:hypothetical protein GCM10010455_17970 [Microbacterium esteraromaticum]